MPGIFGFFKLDSDNSRTGLADAMASAMMNGRKLKVERHIDDGRGLCVGRAALGFVNPGNQPVEDRTHRYKLVFHGELYNNPGPLADPEYVLDLFIQKGEQCVSTLSGIFSFVIYDSATGELRLFSDKFGLLPLYFSVSARGITFAAEIKSVLRDDTIEKRLDYRSFGDFLHFGQILGQKTLLANIQLLPAASILTYSSATGKHAIKPYWYLGDLFPEERTAPSRDSLEEVVSSLIGAIRSRSGQLDQLGLSLSGGLDSRGILAGLQQDAQHIRTYTLGLPGCADQRLAQRMAKVAGTRHEFVPLEHEYTEHFYSLAERMVLLSDGMYLPHEATEVLALDYFKRADFTILLRGHGGEIAKAALAYPVMVTPRILSSNNGNVLDHIYEATNLVRRDIDLRNLLSPSFYACVNESARESLKESCGVMPRGLTPADVCLFYYINEHIRRQVVGSLDIFRTQIEIRMPYVDEDFIKVLLRLPLNLRNRGEVHYSLVKRCMPQLMKIPDANTGAPLDAGSLRLWVTDKFNSVMKRLSVTGFRHYTEFQKWHREGFRDSSEKIIFCPRTAERDMYNMDFLRTVFDQHTSGRKNYGHLLGTIVGMELWFRLFID